MKSLKKIGLEVPQVTELGHLLRTSGLNINEGILSIDELVNEIKKQSEEIECFKIRKCKLYL